MAFSVRIDAYKWPRTSSVLSIEPNWWDSRELMKDDRFIHAMDETNSYCDYVAILSNEEFSKLHDHYKTVAKEPLYDHKTNHAIISILDAMLILLTGEDDRFHVTVFEWESGY